MLDLEIIIVTYNSQFWLKKALTSIKEYCLDTTRYKVQVTVVDNHSQDETLSMLASDFTWTKVVALDENLGFAAANNISLAKTKARYAMLLNSDVELLPESNLDELIDYLDKNPKVGIITPRVEFTNGQLDPACHRGEPTPWAALTYFTRLSSLLPQSPLFASYHQTYKDLNSTHTIDACSGAALMVRAEAMKKVGLLDERFFMYAEDLDWCRRFREAGWKVVYHPRSVVIHHKNKSGIKSSSQKIAVRTKHYFYNTMLQYYDKHYADRYPNLVNRMIRKLLRFFIIIKREAL